MEVEAAKAEVDFDDYNYDYDPYSTYYSNYTEVHAIHTAPAPPDYVHISVTVILMLAGVAVNGVATAKLAKEEKTNFVFLLKTVAKLAFAVFTLALMNVIAEIFCGYQTTLFPFLFAYLFYPIGVLVTILLQMVLVLMGIDILRNTSDPKASPCSYSLSCTITIAALMSIPSWLTFSVIQTGNGTYRLTVRDTLLNSLGQSVSVWMALLPPTVALLVLVAVVAFRRRKGKDDDDVGWESRVFVWSGLVFASSVAVDVVVLFGVLSFLLPTAFDVLRSPFLPATVGLLPYLVIR